MAVIPRRTILRDLELISLLMQWLSPHQPSPSEIDYLRKGTTYCYRTLRNPRNPILPIRVQLSDAMPMNCGAIIVAEIVVYFDICSKLVKKTAFVRGFQTIYSTYLPSLPSMNHFSARVTHNWRIQ
jgi:hypothetical protein